jgi:predicted MFS family arabinose efflux permease
MLRSVFSIYRAAFSGLSREVWAISSVTLVYRCGTMVLPFMSLYLTSERGFAAPHAGLILAIYGVGALGGSLAGGWLGDAWGPLRVCAVSLVLSGAALFLLRSMQSFAAIAINVFVLSIVSEAFRPASAAAVAAMSSAATRVRAVALRRLAINLGMSLAPAAGGVLAVIDYGWLFIVDGASCFAAAALLVLLFRSETLVGWRRAPRALAPAIGAKPTSPWADRHFVAFLALTALFAAVFFQVFSTFPLLLRDLFHMREDRIGAAIAINALIIVVFEMVTMHRLRRRTPLTVVRLGTLFACAAFVVLPWGVGIGALWVLLVVVLITLGEMFYMPTAEGFVANRAHADNRGRYMGLYTLSYSLAFAVGPALGTWIYDRQGATALAAACGVSGLVLWLGFTRLARTASASRDEQLWPTPPPRRPLP